MDEYGGGWKHTFNSSGGSLEDVYIREAVSNVPPDTFGWGTYYDSSPSPLNEWVLDSGGTMTTNSTINSDMDMYWTRRDHIDANDFTNFPQSASHNQWYYWNCPKCYDDRRFTGPHQIKVELYEQFPGLGPPYKVMTEAYVHAVIDAYTGP